MAKEGYSFIFTYKSLRVRHHLRLLSEYILLKIYILCLICLNFVTLKASFVEIKSG